MSILKTMETIAKELGKVTPMMLAATTQEQQELGMSLGAHYCPRFTISRQPREAEKITGGEMKTGCSFCKSETPEYKMKRGWTNALYCSEQCERNAVSNLHASMPRNALPHIGWLPHHISVEITNRWKQ